MKDISSFEDDSYEGKVRWPTNMRTLLASLVFASSLFGQSALTFTNRERGPVPQMQFYSVGGTGAITVAGAVIPDTNRFTLNCTTIVAPANWCGNTWIQARLSSATAPATLAVIITGYASNEVAPGAYSFTFTVTSTGFSSGLITATDTVLARTLPNIVFGGGPTYGTNARGCVNTSSEFFPDNDQCTVPTGYPGHGLFAVPSTLGTYTDPNLGGVVKILVPGSAIEGMTGDSVASGWSADNSRVYTSSLSGSAYATNLTTGAHDWVFSGASWNAIGCTGTWFPDANAPLTMYCFSGLGIKKITMVTPPSTFSSVTLGSGLSGVSVATNIDNGGDSDTASDNWMCFGTQDKPGGERIVGLVNLANGNMYTNDYHLVANLGTACGNGTLGSTAPCMRFCTNGGGADITTGDRFVWMSLDQGGGQDFMETFRLPSGAAPGATLVNMGHAAQTPNAGFRGPSTALASYYTGTKHCDDTAWLAGNCLPAGHASAVMVNGHNYYVMGYAPDDPFIQNMVFVRMDTPDNAQTPSEIAGAGLGITYATIVTATPYGYGFHVGCARKASVCALDTDQDPNLVAYKITGATFATPIHITSAGSSYDFPYDHISTTSVLRVGGMVGNTALNNGSCTVANLATNIAATSYNGTGNGVLTMDPTTPVLLQYTGTYTVKATTVGVNSATFTVTNPTTAANPSGVVVGTFSYSGAGAVGSFATSIKFTITDGSTDFALNDQFNITVGNPQFDCAGSVGNGTWTSGGFYIQDNIPLPSNHQGEIIVLDATNLLSRAITVRRVAKHRSWQMATALSGQLVIGYYGQAHVVVSPDGTLAAYETNMGYVEQSGVNTVSTGYTPGPTPGSFLNNIFLKGVVIR